MALMASHKTAIARTNTLKEVPAIVVKREDGECNFGTAES